MLLDQVLPHLEAETHGVYSRREWTDDFDQCKTFAHRVGFRTDSAP